ncbi:hypothetical protein RI367_005413 [Sorochytrium milnesiophthora]
MPHKITAVDEPTDEKKAKVLAFIADIMGDVALGRPQTLRNPVIPEVLPDDHAASAREIFLKSGGPVVLATLALPLVVGKLGFRAIGIQPESWAARYMTIHQGKTPKDSICAYMQSIGACGRKTRHPLREQALATLLTTSPNQPH